MSPATWQMPFQNKIIVVVVVVLVFFGDGVFLVCSCYVRMLVLLCFCYFITCISIVRSILYHTFYAYLRLYVLAVYYSNSIMWYNKMCVYDAQVEITNSQIAIQIKANTKTRNVKIQETKGEKNNTNNATPWITLFGIDGVCPRCVYCINH